MKPDGTGVLYGTGSVGPYKLATLPTPGTATSILASGFGGFITGYSGFPAFSPDGNWTLYYKVAGTNPGEFDLNVVHNIAAATGTSLLSAPTGAVFNDAFTADSAYALYYTNFKLIGTSAAVGELSGYPVAGSKAISVSTNSVWNSYGVTGAKVAYNDNYTPASTSTTSFAGYADIYVADLSVSPLVPASIVSADKLKLVFSMSVGNTSTDGIWVVTP
jgi:hypothetical protein